MTWEQHLYYQYFFDKNNIALSPYYKKNHQIDQQCLVLSQTLDEIPLTNSDSAYTIMSAERDFVKIFLSRASHDSSKLLLDDPNQRSIMAWMIYWVYVYDIMFGYDNWNQFRIIQFEWLYNNIPRGFGAIKF